jgi:hypothetical protein
MEPVHRFDPRADSDTATSATGPLPLIDPPEDETLLRVDPPFAETGIVVNRIGDLIARLSLGNGPCGAVPGADLTSHTKVVETKRDGFVRLKGQIGRYRLEAHVVSVPFSSRYSYEFSFLHRLMIIVSSSGAPIVQ